MASRSIYFVLLVIAFSLVIDDAEGGWKFWKKKKDETTTLAPVVDPKAGNSQISGTTSTDGRTGVNGPASANNNPPTSGSVGSANPAAGSTSGSPATTGKGATNVAPNSNPAGTAGSANSRGGTSTSGSPSAGTRGAIAGAANPGLAVGIANAEPNIRNNAQSRRPNPGTEVGLDFAPQQRPSGPGTGPNTSGAWAGDLTGTGGGIRPKTSSQGPALSAGAGGAQGANGGVSRQGSPVNSGGQTVPNRQTTPTPGPRPGSSLSPQAPGTGSSTSQTSGPGGRPVAPGNSMNPNPAQSSGSTGGTQTSTLHVGSLTPGQSRPGSSSGYGSSSPTSSGGASPTGGKSWADVAGSGGNGVRPGSPTPAPRPGTITPGAQNGPNRSGTQTGPNRSGTQTGQITPGTQTGQITPGAQNGPRAVGGQVNGQTGQSGNSGFGTRTAGTAAVAGGAALGAGAAAVAAGSGKTYSSNPIYSKGNGVTDEDLEKLSEALFIKDSNNANKHITLNLQKQTTSTNTADQAPQPLLTVNPAALQIPTIDKVIKIYDNYKLDSRVGEYISPAQRNEESLLVDTFLSTNVMSAAMRFLADKGFVRKDYYEYKDTLRRLWFNLYSRGGDGKIGSSGFEHVFLTELKLGTEVSGLHNWIYFNAEEVAKRADYLGYIKKVDLGNKAAIVKIHAKYNNIDKPVTTMFIGTSPELEMALYTVCFLTRKDLPCPVSLGGTKFNIVTHKFRYRGNDLIGSAYPEI